MQRVSRAIHNVVRRLVSDRWGLVPLVLAGFIVLYQTPGHAALVARQFVYLFAPFAAFVGCARIVRMAPASEERTVWAFLAVTLGTLAVSESYYSFHQIFYSAAGPGYPSAYDFLNALAALVLWAGIVFTTGFARLPLMTKLRAACDTLAAGVISFVGMYVLWSNLLASEHLHWSAVAWRASYSFMGVMIAVGVTWVAMTTYSQNDRATVVLLAGSLTIFATGLVVWPLWHSPNSEDINSLSGALQTSPLLLGYLLMMMATSRRIAHADRGWRTIVGRASTVEVSGLSTVMSGAVLAGSLAMGIRAFNSARGPEEMVFLAGSASIAIMALVARTAFATAETGMLLGTSLSDPVSGAGNHRAFQEACERRILSARRRGTPFTIAMLDIDAFDRVNILLGHAEGDRTLRTIAEALALAGGKRSEVYRLTSDLFAVIGTGVGQSRAMAFATGLLAAVAAVEPAPGLRLSASIGVAATDTGAEHRNELIRRADAAQVWAKYHGKDRVVIYDAKIVRALGVEDRVRLSEEQSYLGIALALAAAADTRDPSHRYHSRNVAALAVLLAEESGMDPRTVRALEIAAMLHDVGRIAMSDERRPVYRGSHPDTPDECEHAELGQQLVESIGVDGMGECIRGHHEWWDGTGCPDGLVGDEIPLGARIIALADAYDGMTSGRRGAFRLSKGAALQEIDHEIGTRYDPELAERFIEIIGRAASLGWSDSGVA